uniref:Cytochrome P450 n=1 Tax=Photinus pyralis TaxID=7054 RepID=A0A1Y1N4A8_PHOPY
MYLILFAIAFAILFALFKLTRVYSQWRDKGVPYIKPIYFLGNFGGNVLRLKSFETLTRECYNAFPNSRYVGLYQFRQPILLIRDPELVKQITIKDFDTFPEHVSVFTMGLEPLLAKNLFNLTGSDWHEVRSTLSPSFTSRKMKVFFTLMAECSDQFINYFKESGDGVQVEVMDAFTRYTNDVIATCAFGITCNSLKNRDNEFYLMGKDASRFSGVKMLKFFGYSSCPSIMKLLNIKFFGVDVDAYFRNIIKETLRIRRQEKIERPDMINLLIEAQRNPKNAEHQMTDEDITAQALIFFLAGFDTVASAMTFLAYELAINPDVQRKLHEEICRTSGEVTYETIKSMSYLECVLSESLRLHSNVPFVDRRSTKPYTIEPVDPSEKPVYLEKGTVLWLPTCALHYDERYFPNPKKFDPERFREENRSKIHQGVYIPFGSGPRACIASRFALLEVKLIVIRLLQNFEIVPNAKTAIPLIPDKTSFNGLPADGVWVTLKPRRVN